MPGWSVRPLRPLRPPPAAVGQNGAPYGAAPGLRSSQHALPEHCMLALSPALPLQGGVQGRVRSWLALGGEVLVFNMRDNRWCGHVGRCDTNGRMGGWDAALKDRLAAGALRATCGGGPGLICFCR